MRPDETSSAGDENPHAASVETKGKRGNRRLALAVAAIGLFLCGTLATVVWQFFFHPPGPEDLPLAFQLPDPLEMASIPTAYRFDFPLGSEHGAMAYNAQPFTVNRHLGDDLNGIGGENSDLGDPIFAVADGLVLLAREGGPGWGKVIILLHAYLDDGQRRYLQSYYGHVDTILVRPHQIVRRGDKIATVGTAHGKYFAHLHLEMREFITPFVGPGYREDTNGWLNPTEFIRTHRGAPEDDVGRPSIR
ncbi:MAG TPA: M23 family metallopeptidase [Verrucomicrobiaceae bacterium]|jgi:murein DD-endopeptidase MepM/ murein hydrolase activator NlpD